MNALFQLWNRVKSDRLFVAFEGAFFGTVLDLLEEQCKTGHLDFTQQGITRMVMQAAGTAFVAVRLLLRPSPTTLQPSSETGAQHGKQPLD